MPNIKSAEKRVRSSEKKHAQNKSVKSRLKTLEKNYLKLLSDNKMEEGATAYRAVASALDKAAKSGTIRTGTADRKKSRLALRLKKTAA